MPSGNTLRATINRSRGTGRSGAAYEGRSRNDMWARNRREARTLYRRRSMGGSGG